MLVHHPEAAAFERFCAWLTELYRLELPHFIDRNYDSVVDLARPLGPVVKLVRLGGFRTLATVDLAVADFLRPVGIIHRRQRPLTPTAARFVEMLQRASDRGESGGLTSEETSRVSLPITQRSIKMNHALPKSTQGA